MSDRRTVLALITLVMAQLVLLAAQVQDRDEGGNLLSAVGLRAVAPFAHLVAATFDTGADLRRTLRLHGRLREENRDLEERNRELAREVAELRSVEAALERLAEAVDYEPPEGAGFVVADVVYVDHASWLRTLVLRLPEGWLGEHDAMSAPVTTPDGLVGRVIAASGDYLRVQLVTDRASSVGAMIERTRRQGIVRGADGGLLSLDYVPQQAEVRLGDRIVTAGIDGVFPRGIPLGTVVDLEEGDDLFHRLRLRPAADLDRLDQVYVLDLAAVPEELKEPPDATP